MPQKKQTQLETTINEILIVNNKKLNPYIELVNFSSRNVDQKKLGTILGIFEIKDTSEDSAYIVNFLSSVAKKTYFASHQKSPESSFESTLAKVNLSLSEVAKHGNINWIGKIDAILCSVFENQINFSVSGDAKVLLLRNGRLTEISAGLSPKDEFANPLKTFTDIASGRLENADKLIITTDDISHIFTLEELEKYALSFNNNKFLRFLNTALVNELDIAGTIVIDAKKVTKKIKEKLPKKKDDDLTGDFNLFGSTAFEKNKQKKETDSDKNLQPGKNKADYIHRQTGHIYITDSEARYENFKENKFEQFIASLKEKFIAFSEWVREKLFKKLTYKIKKKISTLFSKKETIIAPLPDGYAPKKNYGVFFSNLYSKIAQIFLQGWNKLKQLKPTKSSQIKHSFNTYNSAPTNQENYHSAIRTTPAKIHSQKKFFETFIQKITPIISKFGRFSYLKLKSILNYSKKILPHFLVLKNTFLKMNFKLKLITLVVIITIFILPLVLFLRNNKDNNTFSANTSTQSSNENLEINPSTQSYQEATLLYENSDLIGSFIFNNLIFAISKNKITQVDGGNKDYPFPENFKNAVHYSFMDDLNLLFLLNDKNQIISFSPISLKFKDDAITIKEGATIEGIGTYLTYLYLIDSTNKQIYRYPRADNGFGEKIDWLGSDINFDNISGVAIDGNLYLAKKDSILKLFNRKTQDFNLKIDSNSSINGIFTSNDVDHIYILDNLNGELIKFDKNGNKIGFVSNQNLSQARTLWVNEKEASGYFVSENSLFKISLP